MPLVTKSDLFNCWDLPWNADNERGVSALQILVDWLLKINGIRAPHAARAGTETR